MTPAACIKGTRERRARRCSIRKLKYDGSAVNICLSTNRLVEKNVSLQRSSPICRQRSAGGSTSRGARFAKRASTRCRGGMPGLLGLRKTTPSFQGCCTVYGKASLSTLNMSAIDRNPPWRQPHRPPLLTSLHRGRQKRGAGAGRRGSMNDLLALHGPTVTGPAAAATSGIPGKARCPPASAARLGLLTVCHRRSRPRAEGP